MLSIVFSILLIIAVTALCIYILEWGVGFIGISIDGRIIKALEFIIVLIALYRIIYLILSLSGTTTPLV